MMTAYAAVLDLGEDVRPALGVLTAVAASRAGFSASTLVAELPVTRNWSALPEVADTVRVLEAFFACHGLPSRRKGKRGPGE
ncbi:hypothetical protein [Streptomyces sp. NPDC004250]|uniref:hypothetical protein n=1 Tax=Streptomyces sp. NPDC004250 TaxID=3364692 RepID=UPI00369AEBDC